MVYKKYGVIFKNLRKHNDFKLTDFSTVGIPTSTLSDFERGKNMLSLEKIDKALQLMGYTLSDFDSYINHYQSSDLVYIIQEIGKALPTKNIQRLEELQELSKHSNQKQLSIALNILIHKGSLEEKFELICFLSETQIFGKKELIILYIILPYIHPQDIFNIINNLKIIGKGMASCERHYWYLSHVFLELIVVLSNYGLKEESKYYIQRLEELNLAQTMFLNNLFQVVKGYWIYCFKNKIKGKMQIVESLKIQELACPSYVSKFYKDKFEKLMELSK